MQARICSGLLLAILIGLPLAAQDNPVTNGGFEALDGNGFPVDWVAYIPKNLIEGGEGIVDIIKDAHSGNHAIRLKLDAKKGALGLNRVGKPKDVEGPGKMLMQLRGGIGFYYKAIRSEGARLSFCVIPMKADGIEGGGKRSTYVVPPEHIGDGAWHRWVQKYDYTGCEDVKYIQVCPRIHLTGGEILFDDIRYVPQVGPLAILGEGRLQEIGGQEGRKCVVTCTVENAGDARAEKVTCRLEAPNYLKLVPGAEQTVPRIEADGKEGVSWMVEGIRSKVDQMVVTAEMTGGEKLSRKIVLRPDLVIDNVIPDRFIVTLADEFGIVCRLGNKGTANALGATVSLHPSAEMRLAEGEGAEREVDVPAGGSVELRWKIKPRVEGRDGVALLRMQYGGVTHEANTCRVVLAPSYLRDECDSLSNEHIRLNFPRASFGYGVITIEVFNGQEWVAAGAIPRLGRCVWLSEAGERGERPIYAPEIQKGISNVVFKDKFSDTDGRNWSAETVFSISSGKRFVNVESRLKCDRDAKLLCFEGPMVYAGEGAFGGVKSDALFPGLEWLVGEEVSSSLLDDHTPNHVRYVPHPNKITIPLMAVRKSHTLLGVMWNPLKKWTRQRVVVGETTKPDGAKAPLTQEGADRPCAVFASPNQFEGTRSHLMGIMVPSVPTWMEENAREASVPFALAKNSPIEIEMQIIGRGDAQDCLSAVDCWFETNGVIAPMPIPRGNYEKEIEFSMSAYLDTLWIPEKKMWWSSICPHPLLQREVRSPQFCMGLYMASQLARDKELRSQYLLRLHEVLPLLERNYGVDLAYRLGNVEAMLKGAASQVVGIVQGQGEQGEWRFNGNRIGKGIFKGRDYGLLGPHNSVEVGTCAANAKRLLHFARMTGDGAALEAGLKALKFMERFDVPRAAQVWEVPVHTPDVLAAALASHAYLEGYRITEEKHYLAESVRWARAGLPFIYFWNVEEFPFMRYASIPVFGATWYQGSWIGRPVQWNGLEYAHALFDLAEHDDSFPWRKVAEGITISALYQQSTDKDKDYALWPDSISAIDAKKSAWVFAPHQILTCIFKMLGRPYEPTTVVVQSPNGRIHITSSARVDAVDFNGEKLAFRLCAEDAGAYYTTISPIAPPTKIVRDGEVLPSGEAADQDDVDGCRYTPSLHMLAIRWWSRGMSQIEVHGVKPELMSILPKVSKEISFQFDNQDDAEGWRPAHDVDAFLVKGGTLRMKITGRDPYIIRENMKVERVPDRLVVRMRATKGSSAQVFWCTKESEPWGEDKYIDFPIQGDGQFHDYEIDLASHEKWNGQHITALRIDPLAGDGFEGAEVEIDFIKGKNQHPNP
ncbi:MAG: hypothetical protein AB1696_05250 [Planctomycetota bacterium]